MSYFIISIEQPDKSYAVARIEEGVIRITKDKNCMPSIFELERVVEPDNGFKLKGDGEYYYRCKHGPLIPCPQEVGDVFEYSFENKILKIKRPDEEYVCVFREGVLMADQVLHVNWNITIPTIKVGGCIFYFFVSSMVGSRLVTSLFLSPISAQSNICIRQGGYGKEIICCMEHNETIDKKFYVSRNGNNLIVSILKEKAELFLIKNNVPYIYYEDKILPLIAGDQSVKGYQVTFPTTFINFHPL
ncbi:hypothetical protein ENUP19_0102G0044 [Entamoeba nuttalli]|uniref:Uncharacterized protein n=2 Tax=Entamoeba nuttalli TaxID=412467 RepID=K2HZ25_ENTNP|nr:hypothetical protein ENU1_048580 [Entamoeba nuttalli P19]EKE41655.1 hypothetical protein ENU1_048580 [Entamoeba nuttalli P19]|eukprot:XP_008856012.1 hypothetical protein ENU1_048580 [Entamoeba nuttalli P19]